jgi:putative glutamine amidotransferase
MLHLVEHLFSIWIQMVPGSLVALAMGTHEPIIHSFHHQAIEKLASDLTVVGTHQDGTIEAVQHNSNHWVIGVQWHPEDTAANDATQQGLFNALIQHVR